MSHSLRTALFTAAALASIATAQTVPINPQLVGTWSTKSHQVFTGPVRTILRWHRRCFLSREKPQSDQQEGPYLLDPIARD